MVRSLQARETRISALASSATSTSVPAPGFFNMPECESKTVKCVFALSELGTRKASYLNPTARFRVRAAESFGKAGEAICSDAIMV